MTQPKNYSIRIEGLDELHAAAQKLGADYVDLLTQAMRNGTVKIKEAIQKNIIDERINFQGGLHGSVKVNRVTATEGIVGIGELYGGAVEYGRRPGKPPPAKVLRAWAALKLKAPGAEYAVAKKIGKEGTKAHPFVKPAFYDNIDYVFQQFVEVGQIIVKRLGD